MCAWFQVYEQTEDTDDDDDDGASTTHVIVASPVGVRVRNVVGFRYSFHLRIFQNRLPGARGTKREMKRQRNKKETTSPLVFR